jgi:hypothetical protein
MVELPVDKACFVPSTLPTPDSNELCTIACNSAGVTTSLFTFTVLRESVVNASRLSNTCTPTVTLLSFLALPAGSLEVPKDFSDLLWTICVLEDDGSK